MPTKTRPPKASKRPARKVAARLKTPPAARPKTPSNPQAAELSATKLDRLAALLAQRGGASIAEMTAATGWQSHSVRGALAGALKRRGLAIASEKVDGVRRYRSHTPR